MVAILHKIRAFLYANLLTPDPNDYIIRVISERTLNVKEICEAAVSRGGANVSASTLEHHVNIFLKEMAYQLCDGYSVNVGWFTAMLQVRGVANSPTEKFTKGKHTALFEFHQGVLSRRELENVVVEILGVAETGATIAQVLDVKTGSVNDLLTPNRNLKITGHKLKIAGDNPANGVYFIDENGNREKVDVSDVVINNPSELMILIPALRTGVYQLEVTTQFSSGGGQVLNEPRSVLFDRLLNVP
jgi:hypothetical protein